MEEFKQLINQNKEALVQLGDNTHYLEIKPEWLSIQVFDELYQYGPFGQGIEIPSFRFNDYLIKSNRLIRGGISFEIMIFGSVLSAVYFQNQLDERLIKSDFNSFTGRITLDEFRGVRKLKILIESFE